MTSQDWLNYGCLLFPSWPLSLHTLPYVPFKAFNKIFVVVLLLIYVSTVKFFHHQILYILTRGFICWLSTYVNIVLGICNIFNCFISPQQVTNDLRIFHQIGVLIFQSHLFFCFDIWFQQRMQPERRRFFNKKKRESLIFAPLWIPLVSFASLKLHTNLIIKIRSKKWEKGVFICAGIRFDILLMFSRHVRSYFVDLFSIQFALKSTILCQRVLTMWVTSKLLHLFCLVRCLGLESASDDLASAFRSKVVNSVSLSKRDMGEEEDCNSIDFLPLRRGMALLNFYWL